MAFRGSPKTMPLQVRDLFKDKLERMVKLPELFLLHEEQTDNRFFIQAIQFLFCIVSSHFLFLPHCLLLVLL